MTASPPDDCCPIAARLRMDVVQLSHEARTPHLASCLSCIDILTAVYFGGLEIDADTIHQPDRDLFILSKGHAATALYAALTRRGLWSLETLASYNTDGSLLPEHPSPGKLPGIEAATGSLGHGLPIALGRQLARRIQGTPGRAVVLLSDGECQEGSVWEAAMVAAAQRLGTLAVIVDANAWQATARTAELADNTTLVGKWRAFGWRAVEIDGHDCAAVADTLRALPRDCQLAAHPQQPLAIVAHTVKGKGVSFMADDNNWHYRVPTANEVLLAAAELGVTPDPLLARHAVEAAS